MKPSRHDSVRGTDDILRACAEPMDARAKAEIRSRVMAAARSSATSRRFASLPRRVAASLAVLTALSGGVAYAANDALPGDFLYPVKRALENAVVAVLPDGELERTVLVEIATRRAEEAAQVHREGPTELSTDSLRELRDALERVSGPDASLTEDEEAQIRERAGEHGEAPHDAVDDVIGTEQPSGTGTPQPEGSGSGTSGSQGPGTGGNPDPGTGSGQDSGTGGTSSSAGQPPDTSGSGAGAGPGRRD